MLPVYDPVLNLPPPAPLPSLQVTEAGKLYLTQALMHTLGLRNGSRIGLVPPVFGSMYWHLDLRSTAPRAVEWSTPSQGPRVKGIILPPGLVLKSLRLYLLPGEPAHPKYYSLLPANAFTP
jgi:hypothetical protein